MPNFYSQAEYLSFERENVTYSDIIYKLSEAVKKYNNIQKLKNADIFKDYAEIIERIEKLKFNLSKVEKTIESSALSIDYFDFIDCSSIYIFIKGY
jgi:hypothetical protein